MLPTLHKYEQGPLATKFKPDGTEIYLLDGCNSYNKEEWESTGNRASRCVHCDLGKEIKLNVKGT